MRYVITLRSNWRSVWQLLQVKFPDLTEIDFQMEEGTEQKTFERLQVKLGKSRQELVRIINGL